MTILVPLAPGFEETEAVSVIDVLRRAGIKTVTAAVSGNPVKGSHDIEIIADTMLNEKEDYSAIVLPGGMPGTINLRNDKRIISITKKIHAAGGITAAICAAPIVLFEAGITKNKRITCYPGFEKEITDAVYSDESVVKDGTIITAKGAACAVPFALKIVEEISGADTAENIKKSLMSFW